jgi:YD repeat-containing protein
LIGISTESSIPDEEGVAMNRLVYCAVFAAFLSASAAQAAETIVYTYDAKGRLVKVVHTGSVNNNVQATYTYDKADNRKNVTTTGATI